MTERILVVEDNRALAENVAELLEEVGAEVTLMADAESAAEHAGRVSFDLAIVDISLGGKESGLELLPKLRRASAHTEIVLMTGNASLKSAIQAIRSGVYAYITKPFAPDELVTLVRRALAQVALKRDKQALTQRVLASEALYRGVVESVEACIVGLGDEAAIQFCNRFTSECLGLSQAQLVGRSFWTLCDQCDLKDGFERARRGESVRDQECVHVSHLGERVVRWTLRPLTARGHEPDGAEDVRSTAPVVLAVGIDITDRLSLERKKAEAEALAVMGTLTTSLAHEIRNPLNAASLQLELLLRRARRAPDPAVREQLAEPAGLVREELTRLSALLDEFLNLARPRGLSRSACNVAELLRSVTELKQPLAQSLGIALRAGLVDPSLSVHADRDKLKQVLINLVGNAIEALHEANVADGVIELAGRVTAGGVCIVVADNGPGVPEELVGQAFKPFVTSKQGGTGLGLAIVHKIVSQHGGEVRLSPRPQGGTSAEVLIPT